MSAWLFPSLTLAFALGLVWWAIGPEFLIAVGIITAFMFWLARAIRRSERDLFPGDDDE